MTTKAKFYGDRVSSDYRFEFSFTVERNYNAIFLIQQYFCIIAIF